MGGIAVILPIVLGIGPGFTDTREYEIKGKWESRCINTITIR